MVSRTSPSSMAVLALRTAWVMTILYWEIGVFFHRVIGCTWPQINGLVASQSSESLQEHVLIIADPQILDKRSYPGRPYVLTMISRYMVDLNMRKSWAAARTMNPSIIIFLGDMMDSGRIDMPEDEYQSYYRRFRSIFRAPKSVPRYYVPGNHDTGIGRSDTYSKRRKQRYLNSFGPLNSVVSIANHSIVLLDAPGLVEEDYEMRGAKIDYSRYKSTPGRSVHFIHQFQPSADDASIVLFSHIPMSRPDGGSCGPTRERGTLRPGVGQGYQNTLGKSTTSFLLSHIQPSIIFSGDDHDACETFFKLDNGRPVKERTVKSFSMAMGIKRPAFHMLTLVHPQAVHNASYSTFAEDMCILPDQNGIYFTVYVPFVVVSILILVLTNYHRVRTSSRYRRAQLRTDSPTLMVEEGAFTGDSNMPSSMSLSLLSRVGSSSSLLTGDGEQEKERQRSVSPNLGVGNTFENEGSLSTYDYDLYNALPPLPLNLDGGKPQALFRPRSWSFVLLGRTRRLTLTSQSVSQLAKNIFEIFWSTAPRPEGKGFAHQFRYDFLSVAILPLSLFVLITLWFLNFT